MFAVSYMNASYMNHCGSPHQAAKPRDCHGFTPPGLAELPPALHLLPDSKGDKLQLAWSLAHLKPATKQNEGTTGPPKPSLLKVIMHVLGS